MSHPAAAHTLLRVPDATDPDTIYARPTGLTSIVSGLPALISGEARRSYTAKSDVRTHKVHKTANVLDAEYPKAVTKLDKDWSALTAFFDFPAEHWRHLRTTNPIESSFATVKLRTRVTKGAGSKTA
jgi:putative transposase